MDGANAGGKGNRSNSQLAGCIKSWALCSWAYVIKVEMTKAAIATKFFMGRNYSFSSITARMKRFAVKYWENQEARFLFFANNVNSPDFCVHCNRTPVKSF